ncbi:hypothetical protein L1887_10359 [Cichorium endivia]|nr:hypothetical protein L1887_10359 [Cichorium endivia]
MMLPVASLPPVMLPSLLPLASCENEGWKDLGLGSKHGSKVASSDSKPEPVQALLIVKYSNKDESARIVVYRFKFEELQLEQIHNLEGCSCPLMFLCIRCS